METFLRGLTSNIKTQATKFEREVELVREYIRKELGVTKVNCYPSLRDCPLTNLVCQGKAVFLGSGWSDDPNKTQYVGEVIENPTYLDACVEFERLMLFTGDTHHVFLEQVAMRTPDDPKGQKIGSGYEYPQLKWQPGVRYFEMLSGS